jgi:hypothetical protein
MSPATTQSTAVPSPSLSCDEVQTVNNAYEGDMIKPLWDELEEDAQAAWLEGTSEGAQHIEDLHRVKIDKWVEYYAKRSQASFTNHGRLHVGTDGKMVSCLRCNLFTCSALTSDKPKNNVCSHSNLSHIPETWKKDHLDKHISRGSFQPGGPAKEYVSTRVTNTYWACG